MNALANHLPRRLTRDLVGVNNSDGRLADLRDVVLALVGNAINY